MNAKFIHPFHYLYHFLYFSNQFIDLDSRISIRNTIFTDSNISRKRNKKISSLFNDCFSANVILIITRLKKLTNYWSLYHSKINFLL